MKRPKPKDVGTEIDGSVIEVEYTVIRHLAIVGAGHLSFRDNFSMIEKGISRHGATGPGRHPSMQS
jgi:hypothetical protein